MRTFELLAVASCAIALCLSACSQASSAEEPVAEKQEHRYFAKEEQGHVSHWSYEGETGPEHWGDLAPEYVLAKIGKKQSPIDVRLSDVVDKRLPQIIVHYRDEEAVFVNNGHTLQHNKGPGNVLIYDAMSYRLHQFHVHTPSEHTVDGNHFPMEIHLVHKGEDDSLLVVGVMAENGSGNEKSTRLAASLPTMVDQESDSTIVVNPKIFLPESAHYYRYEGSLTTPPCTEGVTWLLMETPIQLPAEIIDRIEEIEGKNNRPVQPLNGRVVNHNRH